MLYMDVWFSTERKERNAEIRETETGTRQSVLLSRKVHSDSLDKSNTGLIPTRSNAIFQQRLMKQD